MNAAHPLSVTTGTSNFLAQQGNTHTVSFGDSLYAIARANNVSVDDLLAANPQIRNANEIYPGDLINIPGSTNNSASDSAFDPSGPNGPGGHNIGPGPVESPQAQQPISANGIHTVMSGDSLSAIARANNVSLNDLLVANPQITNPNSIFVGDQINIPGQASSGSSEPVDMPGPYDRPRIPASVNPPASNFPPPPNIPGINAPVIDEPS